MNIRDTLLVESFRRIAVIYHPSARLIGTSPLTGALYAAAGEGGRLGGPETGEPFEEIYNSILKETYKSLWDERVPYDVVLWFIMSYAICIFIVQKECRHGNRITF